MEIDPYKPCPFGSTDKIKFAWKDLSSELEKILKMLQGGQMAGCVEFVEQLLEKHPDHEGLLCCLATIHLQNSELEQAKQVIGKIRTLYPDNVVATAHAALLVASEQGAAAGEAELQTALEKTGNVFSAQLYEAIGAIGQLFYREGNIPAAIGHFSLQSALGPQDDQNRGTALLFSIFQNPDIPLILKDDPKLVSPPEDAPWNAEFNAAVSVASKGQWREGIKRLEALTGRASEEFCLWKNIATISGWLGEQEKMLVSLRKITQVSTATLDQKVEAEALAQAIDPQTNSDQYEIVKLTFNVTDGDQILEKLRLDKRASKLNIDLNQLATEDSPPPKAAYILLDRDDLESGKELTREQIPIIVGEMLLFGKQTDREARLELSLTKADDFNEQMEAFKQVCGDLLILESAEEELLGKVPVVQYKMHWNWRFPTDTPADLRIKLLKQQQEENIFSRWPSFPLAILGGKTPKEAAEIPNYQIPLLAAILLFEITPALEEDRLDYNQLRSQLNLPVGDPIDPANRDPVDLSVTQLLRLELDKLSPEQLLKTYHRAIVMRISQVLPRLAALVLETPEIHGSVDLAQVYGVMSQNAQTTDESLEWIDKAIKAAEDQQDSPATWLLAKLEIFLQKQDQQHSIELINRIQSQFANEPGIGQNLVEMLMRYGLISPEAMMQQMAGQMPPGAGGPPSAAAPNVGGMGAGGPQVGAGPAAPAAAPLAAEQQQQPEQKSKLWVPGMD